jgi:hypothetical protein
MGEDGGLLRSENVERFLSMSFCSLGSIFSQGIYLGAAAIPFFNEMNSTRREEK